jgi:hypothetical protein
MLEQVLRGSSSTKRGSFPFPTRQGLWRHPAGSERRLSPTAAYRGDECYSITGRQGKAGRRRISLHIPGRRRHVLPMKAIAEYAVHFFSRAALEVHFCMITDRIVTVQR